jgi:hypothetical protein
MPKSNEPRAPARHTAVDSAPLTAAEQARAIIERQLAHKKHGPPGFDPKHPGKTPGKGGWSPPTIRPGGRGRRG